MVYKLRIIFKRTVVRSNSNTGSTFRPIALTACLACYLVMDSRCGTLLLFALWKSSIARHVPCKDTPMQQEKSSGGAGGETASNQSQPARKSTHAPTPYQWHRDQSNLSPSRALGVNQQQAPDFHLEFCLRRSV